MLTEWLLIGLGIVLTAGTAIFVAAEFSMVTLDPAIVERQMAETGTDDWRSRSLLQSLKHLSTQLSGAQVGITLTTILLGYTTQPALTELLSIPLRDAPWVSGAAAVIAATVSLVLVNLFSMLFGELVPKNLALSAPLPTALWVAPPQRAFTTTLKPLIVLLNDSANVLLRRVGVEPREELSGARSAQELAALVRRSAEAGTLDEATAELLTNSIDFERLTAVDVMTDRTRMVTLSRESSAADVVEAARQSGHSRFPVLGVSADDIVGLVHVRRAIGVPYDRRSEVPVGALMVDAPQVPETVRLGPLLVQLREVGMQLAVVVDEYGGTSGIVTLEDVVEELVGDVADEHDPRRVGVYRRGDGAWTVPGVLRPDELEESTGIEVPEGDAYETLGGLVMDLLGRLPRAGDVVEVPGVLIAVEQISGRRVERLRVEEIDGDDGGARPDGGEQR